MIRRIDRMLIDRVFQPVVDFTQRRPEWLVRQCALACALSVAVRHATDDTRPMWATAMGVFCCLLMAGLTFMPTWVEVLGTLFPFRVMQLIFVASSAASVALGGERFIASLLTDVLFTGVYYFAACLPPKPKEPRRRLAAKGAQ